MTITVVRPPAQHGAFIEREGVRMFTFDATISESPTLMATPTVHPLEDGAEATDHIRIEPREVVVTGIVSNTPIVSVMQDPDTPSRDFLAWDRVEAILRARQPVDIITRLRTYRNMAMVSAVTNRDESTGQALTIALTFRELVFAESMFVEVPPNVIADAAAAANRAATSASSRAEAGRTQAEEDESERPKSLLASLRDAFK